MRYFAGLCALFLLGACGAPTVMPTGQPVSAQKMLAETRGKPYECIGYSASSDTCEGISKRRVSGNRVHYDVAMLIEGPRRDTIRVTIKDDFQIENGRICGNMSNAEIRTEGRLTPAERSLLEELFLAHLITMGDVCGSYVRDASGRYTSVTTDRQGRVFQDGVEPVQFFSRPKRLRTVS